MNKLNLVLGLMSAALSFSTLASQTPNRFVCKNEKFKVSYKATALTDKPNYLVDVKEDDKFESVNFNGKTVATKTNLGLQVSNFRDARPVDGNKVEYTIILPSEYRREENTFTAPLLKTVTSAGMGPTPFNVHTTVQTLECRSTFLNSAR